MEDDEGRRERDRVGELGLVSVHNGNVPKVSLTKLLFASAPYSCSEESKPDSDLDEPWIMTVKGLHNFHNSIKAMEESAMLQQNGSNNNNLYKGGNQQQQQQPKSPSSPNAPPAIDNNFSRKQEAPSKHIETISSSEINPGLVQLREKASAAAAAYERQDRERELLRNSMQEEKRAAAAAAKEVRFCGCGIGIGWNDDDLLTEFLLFR